MMVVSEQLSEMETYINEAGRLTPYEASQMRKTLNAYAREAKRSKDPVLAAEVERLRGRVEASASAPPVRIMTPQQYRSRTELFREAGVVWNQISPAERKALLDQMAIPYEEFRSDQAIQGAFWPEFFTDAQLSTIADYPRSQARRQYLQGQRGGLRRDRASASAEVRAYRRWK